MIDSVLGSRSNKNLLKEPAENKSKDMFLQLTRDLLKILPISFCSYMINSYFCPKRCKNERLKKYDKFIKKSQSFLKKEMDLQKFLIRQRLQTTAILALLKGRQSAIVDKMSQLVIHQSSDSASSSSDDELNLIKRQASDYNYRRMIKSSDKVDKRLLDQYLIQ